MSSIKDKIDNIVYNHTEKWDDGFKIPEHNFDRLKEKMLEMIIANQKALEKEFNKKTEKLLISFGDIFEH